MNLPNKLTILRMIMIPVFLVVLYIPGLGMAGNIAAAAIFILASITDFLDGKIARKYNLVTNFGKFMDPLADKLLVCSALIALVDFDKVAAWIVIIIIIAAIITSITSIIRITIIIRIIAAVHITQIRSTDIRLLGEVSTDRKCIRAFTPKPRIQERNTIRLIITSVGLPA